MSHHHPQLILADLKRLRPTQMTVGMLEVQNKAQHWNTLGTRARNDLLRNQCFPAVLGPSSRYYIVDHHHLGLALIEDGVKQVWLNVQRDLSWLSGGEFWLAMEYFQWAHPYDADGVRQPWNAMPTNVTALKDDPFRSLAGVLRNAGRYAKDTSPFSEFLWADHLRRRIRKKLVVRDFEAALAEAKALAHLPDARHLPGWAGENSGFMP